MKKYTNIFQKSRALFKRWKRTSWAVFTSLNIVVHNCCTRLSSFKASLLKQQGASREEIIRKIGEADILAQLEKLNVTWLEKFLSKLLLFEIVQIKMMFAALKVVVLSHIIYPYRLIEDHR